MKISTIIQNIDKRRYNKLMQDITEITYNSDDFNPQETVEVDIKLELLVSFSKKTGNLIPFLAHVNKSGLIKALRQLKIDYTPQEFQLEYYQ